MGHGDTWTGRLKNDAFTGLDMMPFRSGTRDASRPGLRPTVPPGPMVPCARAVSAAGRRVNHGIKI
jgi:hypothetical protein